MRQGAFRGDFSFLRAILVTLVAAFVIQSLIEIWGRNIIGITYDGKVVPIELPSGNEHNILQIKQIVQRDYPGVVRLDTAGGDFLRRHFCLSYEAMTQGKIWTLVTHGVLHGGILHLLFNMLGIFLIGRALEPILGAGKLGILYLVSTVAGGLLWLVVSKSNYDGPLSHAPYLLGASAAAFGILSYFCAQRPNETITLLLFFVIPCRLKPKWVLWGFLGISVYGLIFSEIYGSNPGLGYEDGIAHSAHLGGLLAGIIYYRMHAAGGLAGSSMPTIRIKRPAWMKAGSDKKTVVSANYTINFSSHETLQVEVDRILDKINDVGFGALTDEEKKTLDRAKNILNK